MERHDRLMIATVLIALLAVFAWNASYGWSSSIIAQNPTFASTSVGSKITINATRNGYNISNISQTNPFTVTINGSVFTGYVSYIEQRSAGLVLNRSEYALSTNQSVLVRRTQSNAFYVVLTKSILYAKVPTVDITIYSAPAQPLPEINRTYNLTAGSPITINTTNTSASVTMVSAKSAAVRLTVTNVTGTAIKPPQGYGPLVILNTSMQASYSVNASLSIKYPCSLLLSNLVPYMLNGNGTWAEENSSLNIQACKIAVKLPMQSVIGLFQKQQVVTTTINPAAAATSILPTSAASTTILGAAQVATQQKSYSAELVAAIVIILIIVGVMYYIGRQKNGKRKDRR